MADPVPGPAPPSPAPPVCARSAQYAAVVLAAAILLLVGGRYIADRAGTRPTDLKRDAARVDLNKAGRSELLQLPGVGPKSADKIIAYRKENGGFHKPDDLRAVNGFGPIKMDKLRPLLAAEEETEDVEEEPARLSRKPAEPPKGKATRKPSPEKVLDLNRASAADLQRLPGIGPTIAQRIVEARERRPFTKLEDLRKVGGIGATKLEQVRPYVMVGQ
jgi:competence ComEA-like helix-hairpin-helix protein